MPASIRHHRRLVMGALVATSIVAAPAYALHWNVDFKRPDKWIPLNWSNVGSDDFRVAINYVYQNQFNTTDVHMNDVADWSSAEIRYVDGFYGDTGWAGQTDCMNWNGTRCGWARVKFNITYGPWDLWDRRFLVCHETGHAIGLRHTHYTDSCMNTGWFANVLGPHDREEINAHY